MKRIKYNINDKVRVRLTDVGRQIYREECNALRRAVPSYNVSGSVPEDSEGWSTWTMWELMRLFGTQMYMGNTAYPFHMGIELVVGDEAVTPSDGQS